MTTSCDVPEAMAQVLKADARIAEIAERYRYMAQCVILGRGYNYATAYEWALKLKELTYTVAAPYSSADFQHGPVAMVTQGFPVFAVMPKGAVFDDLFALVEQLKTVHEVELLVLSNSDKALALGGSRHCAAGRPTGMAQPLGRHCAGTAVLLPSNEGKGL
jgi:glutamine---fructose-6-phosphate transaminase (isomerizing)